MTVSVEPDDARGPGHATIRVPGAGNVAEGGFRISRDPDWPEPNLGPAGWQGAETVLTPDAVARDGQDLLLSVGPAVCERLEEGMFFFALPTAGVSTAVMWPEIEAVHAGSGATFANRTVPPPPTPLVTSPVVPIGEAETVVMKPAASPAAPVPTPALPSAAPAVRARARWPLVLAGLLVVLGACGAGAWWWLHRTPAQPAEPTPAAVAPPALPPAPVTPPVAPPVSPPAPPPTVDLDHMSVRDLVARNNNADMLDQARKRLAAQPGEALLLLETAGEDRHDGGALTLLAQVYDPNKPRQGGIGADPRQAAKAYRDAERNNDHSGAADREALHRTLLAARDGGDVQAKLIEGDFWP